MFGHKATVYCYIDKSPFLRVLASLSEHPVREGVIEQQIEIRGDVYYMYYNIIDEEFCIFNNDKYNCVEIPWDEWTDIENIDEAKTFSYKVKAFSEKI